MNLPSCRVSAFCEFDAHVYYMYTCGTGGLHLQQYTTDPVMGFRLK